jgi:hypothetical protein
MVLWLSFDVELVEDIQDSGCVSGGEYPSQTGRQSLLELLKLIELPQFRQVIPS